MHLFAKTIHLPNNILKKFILNKYILTKYKMSKCTQKSNSTNYINFVT